MTLEQVTLGLEGILIELGGTSGQPSNGTKLGQLDLLLRA